MNREEILAAIERGDVVMVGKKRTWVSREGLKKINWKVIYAILVCFCLVWISYSLYSAAKVEQKYSTVLRQREKKILKFSRLMTCSDKKLLIELPNLTDYDYRLSFPVERGKAKVDARILRDTKDHDRLLIEFEKIYSNSRQVLVEVFVEYYE